ncbi:hypothetical protein Esti_005286 [Eimeria stiedai]
MKRPRVEGVCITKLKLHRAETPSYLLASWARIIAGHGAPVIVRWLDQGQLKLSRKKERVFENKAYQDLLTWKAKSKLERSTLRRPQAKAKKQWWLLTTSRLDQESPKLSQEEDSLGIMQKMGTLRSFLLAWGSLLCLKMGGTDEASAVTYDAARVNCRNAMNAARAQAGLADFGQPAAEDQLPIKKIGDYDANQAGPMPSRQASANGQAEDPFLESVCKAVMSGNGAPPQQEEQSTGTYMYVPQGTPKEMCEEAVDFWSGAVTKFSTLPPAYSPDEDLYKDFRNVSFVGLYNPSANPTVDCAIITCQLASEDEEDEDGPKEGLQNGRVQAVPGAVHHGVAAAVEERSSEVDGRRHGDAFVAKPVSSTSDLAGGTRESGRGPSTNQVGDTIPSEGTRRLSAKPNAVYSLLCLSRPPAFKQGQMPFTEQQWGKVKGSASGSRAAQPQVYAVLPLAAAPLVYSLL